MFRILALSSFTLFAILGSAASSSAQHTIPGQVVDVIDGKTVLVALPSGKVRVQLQYIDVPETGQEFHDVAKAHLSSLVLGKFAEYWPKDMLLERAIGQ